MVKNVENPPSGDHHVHCAWPPQMIPLRDWFASYLGTLDFESLRVLPTMHAQKIKHCITGTNDERATVCKGT